MPALPGEGAGSGAEPSVDVSALTDAVFALTGAVSELPVYVTVQTDDVAEPAVYVFALTGGVSARKSPARRRPVPCYRFSRTCRSFPPISLQFSPRCRWRRGRRAAWRRGVRGFLPRP